MDKLMWYLISLPQGMAHDDNVIVEISLKLASIYAMMDKKVEAEEGYK